MDRFDEIEKTLNDLYLEQEQLEDAYWREQKDIDTKENDVNGFYHHLKNQLEIQFEEVRSVFQADEDAVNDGDTFLTLNNHFEILFDLNHRKFRSSLDQIETLREECEKKYRQKSRELDEAINHSICKRRQLDSE